MCKFYPVHMCDVPPIGSSVVQHVVAYCGENAAPDPMWTQLKPLFCDNIAKREASLVILSLFCWGVICAITYRNAWYMYDTLAVFSLYFVKLCSQHLTLSPVSPCKLGFSFSIIGDVEPPFFTYICIHHPHKNSHADELKQQLSAQCSVLSTNTSGSLLQWQKAALSCMRAQDGGRLWYCSWCL